MYAVIGCVLPIVAAIAYSYFKSLKLIEVTALLRQTEAALAEKVTELELKQAEFAIKEAEYQEREQDNVRTITALENVVAVQDKLLDAYRDDELY